MTGIGQRPDALRPADAFALIDGLDQFFLLQAHEMLARADRGHAELAAKRFRALRTRRLQRVQHTQGASMFHGEENSTAGLI